MKAFFIFLLSFAGFSIPAQDTWKICLDEKVLLNAFNEDEEKNVIKISAADLTKSKNLIISYKEISPQKGWQRSLVIYNDKDSVLRKQNGKKLTLATLQVKGMLAQSNTIRIYTITLPTDPKKAAMVRVRRVHLCTLILP